MPRSTLYVFLQLAGFVINGCNVGVYKKSETKPSQLWIKGQESQILQLIYKKTYYKKAIFRSMYNCNWAETGLYKYRLTSKSDEFLINFTIVSRKIKQKVFQNITPLLLINALQLVLDLCIPFLSAVICVVDLQS